MGLFHNKRKIIRVGIGYNKPVSIVAANKEALSMTREKTLIDILPRPLPPHNLANLPEGSLGLDMGVSCLASRKQSDLFRQIQVLSQLLTQARQEFSGFKA